MESSVSTVSVAANVPGFVFWGFVVEHQKTIKDPEGKEKKEVIRGLDNTARYYILDRVIRQRRWQVSAVKTLPVKTGKETLEAIEELKKLGKERPVVIMGPKITESDEQFLCPIAVSSRLAIFLLAESDDEVAFRSRLQTVFGEVPTCVRVARPSNVVEILENLHLFS